MDLETISAHLEIRQVLISYCRGVDRGHGNLIAGAYHPDAIDRHGAFTGNGEEFARVVVEKFDAAGIVGQHHLTNTFIDLHGDAANVESYFMAWRPQRGPKQQPELVPLSGRYVDRFEKRQGMWKIAERDVIFDWMGEPIPATRLDWSHGYPIGARREADVSARLFG